MAETIEVKGIDEVKKSLFQYSEKLGKKVIRDALGKGIQLIARQARKNAPKDTGRLRKNIISRNSKLARRRGQIGKFATIRTKGKKDSQKNAFYGRFVHDGYKPRGFSRPVQGRPFMRQAFNQQKLQATQLAIRLMKRGADVLAQRERLK